MHNDTWTWRAVYQDESQLCEYNDDGTTNPFADIDQSRLRAFVLDPQREGLLPHVLLLSPEMRLIFYRRRQALCDPNTGEQWPIGTKHMIGFQKTVGGRNVKSVTFLFEDGSSVTSDDPEAVQ